MDMSQEEIRSALIELCKNVVTDLSVELKTGPPPERKSRGFCFVTFETHEQADACKKILTVSQIKGRQLNVSWAESTANRETKDVDDDTMSKVTTLYVSNISTSVQEEILRSLFTQFGEVVKCVIVKNPHTLESRGFAFVQFAQREPCINAMSSLHNSEFAGQKLSVVLAKPPPSSGGYKMRGRSRGRFTHSATGFEQSQGDFYSGGNRGYSGGGGGGGGYSSRGRSGGRGRGGFRGSYNQNFGGASTANFGRASQAQTWATAATPQAYQQPQQPFQQPTYQQAYQPAYQQAYDPNQQQQWGSYAQQGGASVRYSPY